MKAINYPFSVSSFGKVETTDDQQKIYLDRVLTLLSTITGQRPMRPTYGTDVARGVYESGGDYLEGVARAIRTAMSKWLPLITVSNIEITPPGSDGLSKVNVSVILPDLSEGTVSVNTAYIAQDGSTYR